ncbi:hypothetical protein [Parvularcula oceani]|uniref:hypothetical protein n=1 Tax=Parvularcula oceani TaxID=1247963 RepID=UPI00068E1F00|nr:hypothetical protein [Parvularcula oceani]
MRLLGPILGVALIVTGLPLLISPIPVGLILIALGVIVLSGTSPAFAARIRRLRNRYRRLDTALAETGSRLPPRLAEPLENTEPRREEAPPPFP